MGFCCGMMLTARYRWRNGPHALIVSGSSFSHLRTASPHGEVITGSIIDSEPEWSGALKPHDREPHSPSSLADSGRAKKARDYTLASVLCMFNQCSSDA